MPSIGIGEVHISFVPLIAALQLFLKGFESRGRQNGFQTLFASTSVRYEKADSLHHVPHWDLSLAL